MARRFAIAALGMIIATGPAFAEFVPFTMIQNDIQRALGRLDQRTNPRLKVKPKKAAPADRTPAANTDGKAEPENKEEDAAGPAEASAVPLPHLRPAAAPGTPVGGFKAAPEFSEADEVPVHRAGEVSVGGYLAAGGIEAAPDVEAAATDGPLGYAADQPPLPRVNPRLAEAMANIPAATGPAAGKPIRLAALPATGEDVEGSLGMSRLTALGISAKALPPIDDSACGLPDPVLIAALDNGDIVLSGVAKVNHAVAATFATWVRDAVEPAAHDALGGSLTGLRIVDSYSCRTRDNIKNAKLSEHAFGNAIDVAAFRIGKQWIDVGGSHSGDQQAFLDKVRASACGPFKTVLGPGSDSFHTDHFHLDLAKRRTAGPSRGLYCK
jgi:hypothetical protein